MLGTLNTPVAGSKVEPVVGATVCVRVTFVVVAAVVPLVWSLLKTFRLVAVPNGVVVLSLTASIRFTVALVVLLAGCHVVVGRAGRAVDANAGRCRVVPPAVPGMVTVNGQVSVAPTGKEAAVPLLATQAPTTTVAPAGVPAVAVQVALVAAVVADTLVQTKLTRADRLRPVPRSLASRDRHAHVGGCTHRDGRCRSVARSRCDRWVGTDLVGHVYVPGAAVAGIHIRS